MCTMTGSFITSQVGMECTCSYGEVGAGLPAILKRLILRDVLSPSMKKFMDGLAEKRGAAVVQRQLVCMILAHLLA